jgi:hypothetical protein
VEDEEEGEEELVAEFFRFLPVAPQERHDRNERSSIETIYQGVIAIIPFFLVAISSFFQNLSTSTYSPSNFQ